MFAFRSKVSRLNKNSIIKSMIVSLMTIAIVGASLDLFSVKFIEYMDGRLVATSGNNFGLTHPKLLAKNWRTVSVNGDKIFIVTTTGERLFKSKAELGAADVQLLEDLRDELANSHGGYSHISMMDGSTTISSGSSGGNLGGGNIMMSSGTGGGISSSSSSISGGSMQSSTMQSGLGGTGSVFDVRGMNVNMRDDDNFSVSKLGLPFNWSRIFFNKDLVTAILRNGDVMMAPLTDLEPAQAEYLTTLRQEVKDIQKAQAQEFQNTMHHSMNMVSNIFNNVLGQLPKPPSMAAAGVNNMFGDNFPFGPNNSPFGNGFPFNSGAGAIAGTGGAVAIAG